MADLLKVSFAFIAILFLLRKKINIGYVMMAASTVLFVLYAMGPSVVLSTMRDTATRPITVKLLLALSLIRVLELILREEDVLTTMMSGVKVFFRSRKAVIISMPMLIGMLPSLGGAYFSAPMVREATSGLRMSQEERAFVNYWFRHPWEFILPLYPGILLAAAVTGMPLHSLIAANMTYAAMLLAGGFIFSMRGVDRDTGAARRKPVTRKQVLSFIPVFGVLMLVMFLHVELHYALLAVIIPLLVLYRYGSADVIRVLRHGFSRDVIILIFGTMLFKETMDASGAVRNLSVFFTTRGIPALPIICLLPFVTGVLTGLTVGFVGSTFPLILSMTASVSLPAISLAFAAGFIGVLLSPVHLCLVLTREYFKADMRGVYEKLLPACGLILTAALAQYLLLM
jgi:integral membrane protein (TIGR00529 family)